MRLILWGRESTSVCPFLGLSLLGCCPIWNDGDLLSGTRHRCNVAKSHCKKGQPAKQGRHIIGTASQNNAAGGAQGNFLVGDMATGVATR